MCLLVVAHCCFNDHIQIKNNESQCKLHGFDDRGQILTVGLLSSGANVVLACGDLWLLGLLGCCAVGPVEAVGLAVGLANGLAVGLAVVPAFVLAVWHAVVGLWGCWAGWWPGCWLGC